MIGRLERRDGKLVGSELLPDIYGDHLMARWPASCDG
jgi:hypothetical protein